VIPWPVALGVTSRVKWTANWLGPLKRRTADLFAADGVVGLRVLGLLDDRCLVGAFLAASQKSNYLDVYEHHSTEVQRNPRLSAF
jgi:hypothetical protein